MCIHVSVGIWECVHVWASIHVFWCKGRSMFMDGYNGRKKQKKRYWLILSSLVLENCGDWQFLNPLRQTRRLVIQLKLNVEGESEDCKFSNNFCAVFGRENLLRISQNPQTFFQSYSQFGYSHFNYTSSSVDCKC